MYRLTVENRVGQEKATAVISGEAVFIHAEELQSALCETLDSCQHLTIELSRIVVLDATFRALICSLHRYSELVHKDITLQGALARQEDPLGDTGIRGCLLKETNQCCRLWGSIFQGLGTPEAR